MGAGYGTDTYCYDSLRTGRLVSGAELVAQAIFRRLTTARGTLRDGDEGETYGIDIQDFVGQVGNADAADAIPDAIAAEVLKDDRVDSVVVEATRQVLPAGLVTFVINIDTTLRDDTDSFTLTLKVSDVSVDLLGIEIT